jgi:SAM-dependent methyltransferase
VVYALSIALFGRGMSIPDFPSRPDLTGVGLSDDWRYSEGLSSKFAYRNTFYDREPWLDITDPPAELLGTLDFLISSDVFEHVAPPVARAFENSFRLLKPGGTLVLTVPYEPYVSPSAMEHFPNLNEYEVFEFDGLPILVNRTVEGDWEVFDKVRFHGGQGSTLEMRLFSFPALLEQLRAAGFEEITDWTDPSPEFGIVWKESHGFPITARRSG